MGFLGCAASALLATTAIVGVQAQQKVVRGVNAGGWLVLEPWMTPTIFNATATIDEWSLCNALGKQKCLETLQQHWSTFYTRSDFNQMAEAGLNAVRIPLGYWAVVPLIDDEPYVSGQYPYLQQAVHWASDAGLNVFIDIHGAPGSQNGWEETGLVGAIAFPNNQSNSDRTVAALQNLTEEFTKPEYNGAVTNIELLNEPIFALDALKTFYTAGAKVVAPANSSGINVTIHDAFYNPPNWANYNPANANAQQPAEYLTVDTHQFWAFAPYTNLTKSEILDKVCEFGNSIRQPSAKTGIPPTLVGEFSLSTGITANMSADTASDVEKRTWFRTLFEAQNAAFTPYGPGQSAIGWYMWAWKTEYDIDAWSYRKGVSMQYIPSNVSDPSTYAFPINSTGCIDTSHNYTAPALVTQTSLSAAPTSTSGPSGTSSGTTASSTKKSAGVLSYAPQVGAAAVAALSMLLFSVL